MKLLSWSLVVLVAGSLSQAVPAAAGEKEKSTALAVGSTVPAEVAQVKMRNVDGKDLSIADARGERGTLVLFSCNGCPWVKAWEERIVALGNEFQSKGIGIIVINPNDPELAAADGFEEMQRRSRGRGMKFPYVVDATSDVARAFGATRTPEAFLFDGEGKLVYHGTIDDNAREPKKVKKRYLKDALYAVAKGKGVPVAHTKALGCAIKFRGQTKS